MKAVFYHPKTGGTVVFDQNVLQKPLEECIQTQKDGGWLLVGRIQTVAHVLLTRSYPEIRQAQATLEVQLQERRWEFSMIASNFYRVTEPNLERLQEIVAAIDPAADITTGGEVVPDPLTTLFRHSFCSKELSKEVLAQWGELFVKVEEWYDLHHRK